jgi:hypothetical protein
MEINGLEFNQITESSPEQYEIFTKEGKQVGYVRLRWGVLRCDYPSKNTRSIYEFVFSDKTDSCFTSEEQRNKHLEIIANKIKEHEISMQKI